MNAYLVVLLAGIGSYLFRVSMLLVAARGSLHPTFERAARFAVPTAFATLAAGALVTQADAGPVLVPVVAVVVAVVAVRRTGKPVAALLAGMPVVWALTAAVGR